ncbi:MAG: hypothetical protein F6J93_23355 [Oscillatoria sp. SIO1A7]|nr:hypothetical protein [Oscillatoria sp. SIO1A7]
MLYLPQTPSGLTQIAWSNSTNRVWIAMRTLHLVRIAHPTSPFSHPPHTPHPSHPPHTPHPTPHTPHPIP